MNEDTRNRLAAWFDGELAPSESGELEALLERDPEARAYMEQLRQTREGLKAAHVNSHQSIPDWAHVQQRIDQANHKPTKRLTVPRMVMTMAAIMILGIAVWWPLRQASIRQSELSRDVLGGRVEMVETDLEGATPIVYLDQPSGWTVVWVLEAEEAGEI